jgi:hypothetical protein
MPVALPLSLYQDPVTGDIISSTILNKMRKSNRLSLLTLLVIATAAFGIGCNSTTTSTNNNPTLTPPSGGMAAYVNNNKWQSTAALTLTQGAVANWNSSKKLLTITGAQVNSATDSSVILLSATSLAKGQTTFTLPTLGSSAQYINGRTTSSVYTTIINGGTLNLTTVDTIGNLVSGTFNFTGTNSSLSSVTVNGGVFTNVPLIKQ